jgi:YHS domain-containing protein
MQPTQTSNPYVAYEPPAAPTTPVYAPPQVPITPPVTGYESMPVAPTPAATVPPDPSIPPSNTGGVPVSEEAKRPETTTPPQQTTVAAPVPQAVTNQFASTTASAGPAPNQQQLPAGAPPLAFDGFCPVSMRTIWKWVPGDARWGAIHRGCTYLFAGPEEQQKFLANPDYYSPALSGVDPVLAIDHRQSVPGMREHSLDYDNQFFLFSSEATLQQFTANPERYASGVRQAMGIPPGQQVR